MPRGGSPITRLLSHRPVLSAEELLILLINFMKKMKSEQAIFPNPCLEEEEEEKRRGKGHDDEDIRPVGGSCEHENEPSGSIRGEGGDLFFFY
jgi:hypothetical protein